MITSALLSLAFLFSPAYSSALPRQGSSSPHETIESLPPGWKHIGNAPVDAPLTLRAYLAHDRDHFSRLADDVVDPASSRFRKYLDAEELASALPNYDMASSSVTQWLELQGVSDFRERDGYVEFSTTVHQAEKMLDAAFHSFVEEHRTDVPVLRTQSYSLPEEVRSHIDFIYPTAHFFSSAKKEPIKILDRRQFGLPATPNCTNSVCPAQLRKRYNIDYTPEKDTCSTIGITGFLGNFPNITDVKSFLSQYGGIKPAAFPQLDVVTTNNGTKKIPPGDEALTVEPEVDLDYSIAFTGPINVSFISTGGKGPDLSQPGNKPVSPSVNEPYLEFLQYLLALKEPPHVISISYSDNEQEIPLAYARRVCDMFAQAAARGISVIGASGDGGASGTGGNTSCVGPTAGKRQFIPTFPSSCPWITSVGATANYGGAASYSSGGFSNYFPRPKWQNTVVPAYIKELNGSHAGYYNKSGRGIPDVSALGDNYLYLTKGFPDTADGTSCATPVFAAMIALINDIRLRANKPVLGFLNPTLYANEGIFTDIDDMSETLGCATSTFVEPGWQALKGWDPATGLGEPDFKKLRKLLA